MSKRQKSIKSLLCTFWHPKNKTKGNLLRTQVKMLLNEMKMHLQFNAKYLFKVFYQHKI